MQNHYYDTTHPSRPYMYSMEATSGTLPPCNALRCPAPDMSRSMLWPCVNAAGDGWEYVQDHRQLTDEQGRVVAGSGTAYWLTGDTHSTAARYMKEVGPLPVGALLLRPEKTAQELAEELRDERAARIAATDYLMAVDYPLSEQKRAEVSVYRQALRDLPAWADFPWDGGGAATPWPELPQVLKN